MNSPTTKLIVEGQRRLNGEVQVSGAKNSVLKLMAAALLTDQAVQITNVPELSDVQVMSEVVSSLGRKVSWDNPHSLVIEAGQVSHTIAPYELVSKMRASFLVLGALLARYGEATVPLPGGCSIGKRNIDLHVKGLQALGADVQIEHGNVVARALQLTGNKVMLDTPSVGATENIMLAAALAEGSTTLSNAAQEPEIVDLATFLNTLGADIQGAGTHEIIINGVSARQLKGISYNVLPDRIEAATYLAAVAGTGGHIVVRNIIPAHLDSVTCKLEEMGAIISILDPNTIELTSDGKLKGCKITTQPYPGFPTDLQAPFMTLLSVAEGVGIVHETIYENRFKHVGELKRMGADIQTENNIAVVTGVPQLTGAPVKAADLRAGAAMIMAGLIAKGTTEIGDVYHIDRGYEHIEEKLTSLGAKIERVNTTDTMSDGSPSDQPAEVN